MKRVVLRSSSLALLAGGGIWIALSHPPLAALAQEKAMKAVTVSYTADGKLRQPIGYRKWVYLGTPVTPNELNKGEAPFPEFHNVYMDPESFDSYEKTGVYRDGTVIVKELVSVGDKEATSGNGYFMKDFIGLEVSIKDAKRFKNEPGNWAYFSFGHAYPLKETTAKNAFVSCGECHQNSAASDLVFSQYYPVLRAAKPKR